MKVDEIPESKTVIREREHLEAIKKKQQKIESVRHLYNQGYSLDRISKLEGCTIQTVKRYLSYDCNLINGHYGKKQMGPLQPYENEVLNLLSQGLTYQKVTEIIRQKGYKGSITALRVFVSKARYQYDQYADV